MSKDTEIFVGLFLMLCAVCLLGWQAYGYLRYNFWMPVSVITALEWMNFGWAKNPTDWVGLYNILVKIPLSLITFIVGFFVLLS
jgi:hypothetical protein